MTKRKRERLYWRAGRAYGDFRDFADVGGKQEALMPPGNARGTTDADQARRLLVARLEQLQAVRRRRQEGGSAAPTLHAFAAHHIAAKRAAGKVTQGWLDATAVFLQRAVEFFGPERPLDGITPSHVRSWRDAIAALRVRGSERTVSPWTVRSHLFSLSNLYRRAQEEQVVPLGYNPVAALMEKPARPRHEAKWLEVHEAALLLEAARTLPPLGGSRLTADQVAELRATAAEGRMSNRALALRYRVSDVWIGKLLAGQAVHAPADDAAVAYPLIAAFLLTGGRMGEVLGLELEDVSFDRRTVTFRPNTWRRLKTEKSWRVVPLLPQLEEILRGWVFGPRLDRGGRLLFPSPELGKDGGEAMWENDRKLLDRVAARAGWKRGEIRHRLFRHTYTAARLQTLDHGAPVSLYTVSRELGHGSQDMVERIYSHLGTVRHRSTAVEFRVEQHVVALNDRLAGLSWWPSVTVPVTADGGEGKSKAPHSQLIRGEAPTYDECARYDSNVRPLAPEASALSS